MMFKVSHFINYQIKLWAQDWLPMKPLVFPMRLAWASTPTYLDFHVQYRVANWKCACQTQARLAGTAHLAANT